MPRRRRGPTVRHVRSSGWRSSSITLCDLQDAFNTAQSRLSYHLKSLKTAGNVSAADPPATAGALEETRFKTLAHVGEIDGRFIAAFVRASKSLVKQ